MRVTGRSIYLLRLFFFRFLTAMKLDSTGRMAISASEQSRRNRRRLPGRVLGSSVFVAVLLSAFIAPAALNAAQVFTSDGNFGIKTQFGVNEPVFVSGDVDNPCAQFGVIAEGDVYVVPNKIWSSGDPLVDVTTGGFNTVTGPALGGAFFDVLVWAPQSGSGELERSFPINDPDARGTYDLVLDENCNGVLDGPDFVAGFGAGFAFQVGASTGIDFSSEVAAIKGEAAGLADNYERIGNAWTAMSNSAAAVGIGMNLASGDLVSAAVGTVSLAAGQFGIDLPTDYNAGVITVGGKVVGGLGKQLGRQYRDIANDPPDPNFDELVSLDLRSQVDAALRGPGSFPLGSQVPAYPFRQKGNSDREAAQLALLNSIAREAGISAALLPTIEKLQGARGANDDLWTVKQARALQSYSGMLADAMSQTRQAWLNYKAALATDGLASPVVSAADIQIIRDEVVDGFTPQEQDLFLSAGFTSTDLQAIQDYWSNASIPQSDFSRGALIDNAVASIDAALPAVQDLESISQAIVDDLEPFILMQSPAADAGGPYTLVEGQSVQLDGSGSSDPQDDIVAYGWDIDEDGRFDDASGPMPSVTFSTEGEYLIGLQVIDAAGNADIGYAEASVASANRGPEVTAFSPPQGLLTASNTNPVDFSATAQDPDNDLLTFTWSVDGVVQGSGSSFTFVPPFGASGTSTVRLVVSDGNPFSEDWIVLRAVEITATTDVTVPDVTGLDQAAAEAAILNAGLTVGSVTQQNSNTVPAGDVINQNPTGGTSVNGGSAVDLVVSTGPAQVTVPDVVGQGQASAESAIIGTGLSVGTVTSQNSSTVPAGDVISQNPSGGTSVNVGSAVDLVVSSGPAPVNVPDVVGLSQVNAESAVIATGLNVGTVDTRNSSTVPAGNVISQNPAAGASVPVGSAVDLVISSGPASVVGDLDGDGDVDRDDLNLLLAVRGQSVSPGDERDLDGDGVVTVLDARQLVLLCTRPRCVVN